MADKDAGGSKQAPPGKGAPMPGEGTKPVTPNKGFEPKGDKGGGKQ